MPDFKEMTVTQLKEFLAENRANDRLFSEALGELLTRNPDRKRYKADLSFEEIGAIVQEKINQHRGN